MRNENVKSWYEKQAWQKTKNEEKISKRSTKWKGLSI